MPSIAPMTYKRSNDYVGFSVELKEKFVKHRGVLMHVASDLGVGATSVKRWLREDAILREFVDQLRKQYPKSQTNPLG